MVSHIYANLPTDTIIGLSYPLNGDNMGQETILAPSGHKRNYNYVTEFSDH